MQPVASWNVWEWFTGTAVLRPLKGAFMLVLIRPYLHVGAGCQGKVVLRADKQPERKEVPQFLFSIRERGRASSFLW